MRGALALALIGAGLLLTFSQGDVMAGSKSGGKKKQATPAGMINQARPKPAGAGSAGTIAPKPKPAGTAKSAPDASAIEWMARTIWAEARNEPEEGQIAVGHVILTRVHDRRWPSSVKAVVFQPWQFSCWNANDPNRPRGLAVTRADKRYARALDLAAGILSGAIANPMPGATHYANLDAVKPGASFWRYVDKMKRLGKIGAHTFYRE